MLLDQLLIQSFQPHSKRLQRPFSLFFSLQLLLWFISILLSLKLNLLLGGPRHDLLRRFLGPVSHIHEKVARLRL